MNRIVIGAMICAVGAAACFAQATAPAAAEPKAAGQITVLEKMDIDKDGKVTKAELIASREIWFKELDADNDGKLSKAEMDAAAGKNSGKMDANSDGAIVVEEYVAYFAGKDAPKDQPAVQPAAGEKKDAFSKQDADNDGAIVAAEIVAYRILRFKAIDADNDGKITSEELKAHYGKMAGQSKADFMGVSGSEAEKKAEEKPAEKTAGPAAE